MTREPHRRFVPRRHLNKLRWVTLSLVFAMLVLLPFISVYQTYVAAHAYDLLAPSSSKPPVTAAVSLDRSIARLSDVPSPPSTVSVA